MVWYQNKFMYLLQALMDIFNASTYPDVIQSDMGSEFRGACNRYKVNNVY